VSFGRTMMQALELLQLVKRHVYRRSDIEQKAVPIAIIKLRLSEGISKEVSQSVENSTK